MTRLVSRRHNRGPARDAQPGHVRPPSRILEYGYYFSIAYSILGAVLGISIPIAGGGLFLAIAGLCVLQIRPWLKAVYGPIALLLGCGSSLVIVQIVVHGESLGNPAVRSFVTWILGLVIVQALRLRPGFMHRLLRFLFLLGAALLPYLTFSAIAVERARVGLAVGANLSHSGGLAEWFGFCAVYFAALGAEHRKVAGRLVAWVIAVGSVFIVGLTVSRGSLLATALGAAVALRHVLKRGAAPVLLLIIVAGVTYESGVFQRATEHYEERGTEDTGRAGLWPVVVERFFQSPLAGVGVSHLATYPRGREEPIASPHNSFLYLALASGFVPALLFAAFWVRAFRRAIAGPFSADDQAFRVPFLLFTLCLTILGDLAFMSPWGLLALSVGAGAPGVARTARQLGARRTVAVRNARPAPRRPSWTAQPVAISRARLHGRE